MNSDLLDDLAGADIFSTLVLEESYHQFPIAPEDQQKTAFTFQGEHLMFTRCPFGLKPLTSIFQRGLADALRGLKGVSHCSVARVGLETL